MIRCGGTEDALVLRCRSQCLFEPLQCNEEQRFGTRFIQMQLSGQFATMNRVYFVPASVSLRLEAIPILLEDQAWSDELGQRQRFT